MSLPTETRQWTLANKPTGLPTLTGPDATFKLETKPLPALQAGQVLVKLQHFSNDPAQRTWISATTPEDRMYVPPVPLRAAMRARALGTVLASQAPAVPAGSLVAAGAGWAEHAVLDAGGVTVLGALPHGLPPTHYLGALGTTGLTAYYGLAEIAGARPADCVVVSGAAGATGSVAVQLAKRVLGCRRVVGIAGTPAKCRWVVDALGADACVDYKAPDFGAQLARATPGFADVYFDNVGGAVLDAVLARMARGGRVAACGAISGYNSEGAGVGMKNLFEIVANRLSVRGFIILDAAERFPAMTAVLRRALEEGKLRVGADSETVVPTRFEDVPATWLRLFDGSHQGKLVTSLTE